jgi:myosin-1
MGKLSAAARNRQPGATPAAAQPRPVPQPQPAAAAQNRIVPQVQQPAAAVNGFGNSHAAPAASARAPPPPPPSAPAAPREPTCKALYDFNGQTGGELSVKKDDVVIIVQKENNGMYTQPITASLYLKLDGTTANVILSRLVARPPTRWHSIRLGPLSLRRRNHPTSPSSTPSTRSSTSRSDTERRYERRSCSEGQTGTASAADQAPGWQETCTDASGWWC